MLGGGAHRQPFACFHLVPVGLLFLAICDCLLVSSKTSICPKPPVPKNGGFTCSNGCWRVRNDTRFLAGSNVEYYCDGGYSLNPLVKSARCSAGKWTPIEDILYPLKKTDTDLICRPLQGYSDPHAPAALPGPSISLVAAVAATVSGFLLMAMVCVLIKPKSRSCQCGRDYSRMQEPDVTTEGWCPVPLPSYEEAVYGPHGHPLSPTSLQAPLPLILAEDDLVQRENSAQLLPNAVIQTTGAITPPPSYDEVHAAAWGTGTGAVPELLQSSYVPSALGVPLSK